MPVNKKAKNSVTVFFKPTEIHLLMVTKDTKTQHLTDS